MSFDVPAHRHLPIEIYGTEGTLIVPDPNWFGGADRVRRGEGQVAERQDRACPMPTATTARSALADMAHAIRSNRPHRASGDLALHVLEVMEAFGTLIRRAAARIDIATRPERPAPLAENLVRRKLA